MNPFSYQKYFAKKKFFKLFGGEIRIFDETKSNLMFFVKQKAFKLKEDITVFADEAMQSALLKIAARSMLDLSATYDISDPAGGQKLGSLRRKGLASTFVMDQWEILDSSERVVGLIQEDNWMLALVRRYLSNLVPQTYKVYFGATAEPSAIVGIFKQTFNPFIAQFNIDFSMDVQNRLDRRIGIASLVLIQIIEGRQQ